MHIGSLRAASILLACASTALLASCCPPCQCVARPRTASAAVEPARQKPVEGPFLATVVRAVDGDTLVLANKDRIRLSAVNTPEIDEELGLESRLFTKAFCVGKEVRVNARVRDAYGRLVADVVADGRSLTLALVQAGMGHVFLIPPIDLETVRVLLAAQKEAQAARKGIWGTDRYRGDFHFTSFHANPEGDDNENLNMESVRIGNLSTEPRNLRGYVLSNSKGERYVFGDVIVPGGFTIKVLSGEGIDRKDVERQIQVHWNRTFGAWSNRGDTATLTDPKGNVVDSIVHDPNKKKVYPKD